MDMIKNANIGENTVLYMDYGQNEFHSHSTRRAFAKATELLLYRGVLLETRIVPDGDHSEASWEKQIPFFISTLFY